MSWRHTSKENKEIPILYFQVNAFKLDLKKIHILYVLDVGLQVLLLQFENDYSHIMFIWCEN